MDVQGKEEYRQLREQVDDMVRRGVVASDDRGRIRYLAARDVQKKRGEKPARLVGALTVSKRGLGFVRDRETGEEIAIASRSMSTAMHGDVVAVVPFARRMVRPRDQEESPREGEVVEIIQRTTTRITGTLTQSRNFSFIVPDNPRFTRDIYLSPAEAKKAKQGDKVVVDLLPWTDEHLNPEGTISEVLGPSGDARVEVTGVARSFGLPPAFPREVLREADRLPADIPAEEIRWRSDCRPLTTVTIDPEDAKDFDDALSCEVLHNNRIRLGVHIADVSHYVREGTALDAEALARGTSVYLVNEVVPMLPERLSNDLCSLRPREDRLSFSVFLEVNADGKVEKYSIEKSIIHSRRRFSYEEVQKIIDAGKGEHADILLPPSPSRATAAETTKERRVH